MTNQLNYKFDENKILYTNNILKWLKHFSNEKDTLVITPLTKISDLLDFKKGAPLYQEALLYQSEGVEKYLNLPLVGEVVAHINATLGAEVVTVDLSSDKVIKALFMLSEDAVLTSKLVRAFMAYWNRFLTKVHSIVICGFDDLISFENFNMLNVHLLTSSLKNVVNWSNLESLVLLDYTDLGAVIDRDRLKSYLELKTRTVLTIRDLEDYFNDKPSYNSYLIEIALRELK